VIFDFLWVGITTGRSQTQAAGMEIRCITYVTTLIIKFNLSTYILTSQPGPGAAREKFNEIAPPIWTLL